MKPAPLTDYIITTHAKSEMKRRGLREETIHAVLAATEQSLVDRHPAEVVTVYRTTKIAKYWREES